MTNALNHIIYGKPFVSGQPEDDFDTLALSSDLTEEEIFSWRSVVSIAPLARPSASDSQSLGVFSGPGDDYTMSRAHNQNDDANLPVYQYIRLPRDLWHGLAGNLDPLVAMVENPIPPYSTHTSIPPLELSSPRTATLKTRLSRIEAALEQVGTGGFMTLLALLDAVLDERYLLIRGFSGGFARRIELIQGLMLLLPAQVRSELTFSTNVTDVEVASARVMFGESDTVGSRRVVDLSDAVTDELSSPYVMRLAALWDGTVANFVEAIRPIEALASHLLPGKTLLDGLQATAERYALNEKVMTGDGDVPAEELKAALQDAVPPEGELYGRYIEHLILYALRERDTDSAVIAAQAIDANLELDDAFDEIFNREVQNQPDSVYLFIRTRLSQGIDQRWLPRLEVAAMCSMEVAVNDGDSETLSEWLKLTSREPADYGLSDVLHEGILASQSRAREDGDLGNLLIVLAVRRDRETLDTLLNDEALLARLPDPLGLALRDYDAQSITLLEEQGRELFLIALARAARAKVGTVFTPPIIQSVWALFTGDHKTNLPQHFQPESIVQEWVEHGSDWLPVTSRETLLMLMLFGHRDELFIQFAAHLSESEALFPALTTALQRSGRGVNDVVNLIGQLVAAEYMTLQQELDAYVTLLETWDWHTDTLPIVEQMARRLRHNVELSVKPPVLWRMLAVAEQAKIEAISRAAAGRLLANMEALASSSDAEVVDNLLHLQERIQWNSKVRHMVMDWWREYARKQALVRLQYLDKALEGKRSLEEARIIVQTALALRKLLGQRSLEELAQSVTVAYALLEMMADAFDPALKNDVNFDQATMHVELDAHVTDMTPDERKVMAKDFKELAQLIVTLSDNRSKASLRRSDEHLDRQLMSGEHSPQSAVDVMKWMSGYLDGAQDKTNGGGE